MSKPATILYCHCAYAQVVPKESKAAVLKHLCDSEQSFETAADLCEMSARRDPLMKQWAAKGPLKIAACYPRAVKWLFAAAQAELPKDDTEVLNMRIESVEDLIQALNEPSLTPNLPDGAGSPDTLKISTPAT